MNKCGDFLGSSLCNCENNVSLQSLKITLLFNLNETFKKEKKKKCK